MTTLETFRTLMAERRRWPRGSMDYDYRSQAARKLVWIIRGIPTTEWSEK